MKDSTHHLRHIQKKVIQEARKASEIEEEISSIALNGKKSELIKKAPSTFSKKVEEKSHLPSMRTQSRQNWH